MAAIERSEHQGECGNLELPYGCQPTEHMAPSKLSIRQRAIRWVHIISELRILCCSYAAELQEFLA